MNVLLCLPVVPQHADSACKFFVIRGHSTRFPTSPQILPRVEAKSGCLPYRACLYPTPCLSGEIFGSMCLASILDHRQIVLFSKFKKWIHVRDLAIEMDGDHSSDGTTCSSRTWSLRGSIDVTPCPQVFAKFSRMHGVRTFIDVYELRNCTNLRYCLRCRYECVRYGNYRFSGMDSRCHKGKA